MLRLRGEDVGVHRYDVLGELRVDGGSEAAPRRPAQRRLLSVLLLNRDGPITRDGLIDRMWPDGAPSGAVNTLQAHVSGLRRTLGAAAVVSGPLGYRLALCDDAVDADRFARLLDEARRLRTSAGDERALVACDDALALWRGAPYPDLAGDGIALPEVQRLEEAHTAARSLRAAILLDVGRWHEAAEELEQLLIVHGHRERLWELLMLAHYRAGRSADALAAYRDARAALGELGLDPGRPLRDLERRMLVQDPALMPSGGRTGDGGTGRVPTVRLDHGVHAWPLVNREREVARIQEVVAGRSRGVVLVGPAGVGKTRLLHEAAHRAPAGVATILVQANASLQQIPLGAVSDLVRLAPGPVATQLDQLLDVLRSMSTDGPPLVLVDDAHHLDDATLGLLVRALQGDVVRLVASVRNERPVPAAVTQWWKDLGLERVAVGPLRPDEFDLLLDRVLGATAAGTRARLAEMAAGNPLHLREMIRAARDDGALVHDEGEWHLVRAVVGSDRLTELVDMVLHGLSRRSRTGLEVLALARPTTREVIDEVAGAGAVDDLQLAGLVRLEAEGHPGVLVDTSHPLYAENLVARLSGDRRRELGARVAASLQRLAFPLPGDLLRAAALALDAGTLEAGLALQASRDAMVRMDPALSRRLAEVAVAAEGGAEAWLLLGRAQAFLRNHDEAVDALDRAASMASPSQLVEIDSERAAALAFGQREPARAVAVLDDALRVQAPDDAVVARLRVERSLYLAMTGRMGEVLDEVDALRELPLPPPVQLTVGLGETLALAMLGRVHGLPTVIDRYEHLADELEADFPAARDQLTCNRVQARVIAGDVDDAMGLCREWRERVADGRGLHSLAFATELYVREAAGRIGDALALDAAEAAAAAVGPDPFSLSLLLPGLRATIAAQAGRLAEARTHLDAVDVDALRTDARNIALWRQGRAWTHLPDMDAAATAFAEAGRLAVAQGHGAWGVRAWYGAVRMGRPELAIAGLQSGVDTMPGASLVQTMLASAQAHQLGDPQELVAVAERFVGHGTRLLAAEAYAEASRRATAGDDAALVSTTRRAALSLAEELGAVTPALRSLSD